jgi:hypothetical protein
VLPIPALVDWMNFDPTDPDCPASAPPTEEPVTVADDVLEAAAFQDRGPAGQLQVFIHFYKTLVLNTSL